MSDTAMPEPDIPPHPEPHVMQWSELEKTAIRSAIKAERLRLSVPRAESRPEMPAADIWETLTPENRAFSRTQMRLHHEAWQEYAASIEAERDAMRAALADIGRMAKDCRTEQCFLSIDAVMAQVCAALTPTTKEPKHG